MFLFEGEEVVNIKLGRCLIKEHNVYQDCDAVARTAPIP